MHLSRSLIAAVLRGELPEELVEEIARDHLRRVCPCCAEGLELLAKGSGALSRTQDLPATADPVEAVRRKAGWTPAQLGDEERKARAWLKRFLRKVPSTKRRGAIRGGRHRYQGALFATLLLEEARRAIPGDPEESLSLADAALASCEKTHPSDPDPMVRVPALAIRGNARRALGRLLEAERDLETAREVLARSRLDDLAIAAELDFLMGSLRKDQGRFDDASRHLERAAALYPVLGDPGKAASTLLKLGIVHSRAHRLDAAVASAEKALDLLDEGAEPWLLAYAHYNLAYFLHASGDLDRAEEALAAHEGLLDSPGEEVMQHRAWLRARIAWSRGDLGAAERLFRDAYQRAKERGIPFDTALVGLELALVELVRGRTAQVKKLALEALAVFAEQEVERETRAALELLEAAARRDALTRELLERAIAALEGAQRARPASAQSA